MRQRQVGLAKGRQDPNQHHLGAAFVRRLPQTLQRGVELTLEPAEAIALEPQRIQIDLKVEQPQLGGVVGVRHPLQQLHGEHRRAPRRIHEEQLLLRSDAVHAGLDHALVEHALQRLNVTQQVRDERPKLGGVLVALYVLATHEWFLFAGFVDWSER